MSSTRFEATGSCCSSSELTLRRRELVLAPTSDSLPRASGTGGEPERNTTETSLAWAVDVGNDGDVRAVNFPYRRFLSATCPWGHDYGPITQLRGQFWSTGVHHWVAGQAVRTTPCRATDLELRSGTVCCRLPGAVTAEADAYTAQVSANTTHWCRMPRSERLQRLTDWLVHLGDGIELLGAALSEESDSEVDVAAGRIARAQHRAWARLSTPRWAQGGSPNVTLFPGDLFGHEGRLALVVEVLASGSVVVLHPTARWAVTAEAVVRSAIAAGLPVGAMSVVHGDAETLDALISCPSVSEVVVVSGEIDAEHVHHPATLCHNQLRITDTLG